MIQDFDKFVDSLSEVSAFSELKDALVGIEAADYLRRLISEESNKEKLLPAVGNVPYVLDACVTDHISTLKKHGIKPAFVFSGMDIGKTDHPFKDAAEAARKNTEAWSLYDHHQAESAVEAFGLSQAVTPESLFPYLQKILRKLGVFFMIAPYKAWAQLAYMSKDTTECIDAVAGSTELLLFDIDKVILKLDFERQQFTWVKRRSCLTALDNASPDMFVDACLLCGSDLLPKLPQLDAAPQRKQSQLRQAYDLMMGLGRTGLSVCQHYQDEPQSRAANYIEAYRIARQAIRHHIVLTKAGNLEALDRDHAPGDMHEFMGQRLPDEVYHYLSRGVIGPTVLNWRTSGEIIELPPLDNGESEEYRTLVKERLTPLRTLSLSLLSHALHNYYQHKDVTLRCYFAPEERRTISMRDLPDPRPLTRTWNVREGDIERKRKELKAIKTMGVARQAVASLDDEEFASASVTPRDPRNPLTTRKEVRINTVWRFLHVRGYLDSNHQWTAWGKVLSAAMTALGDEGYLEDSVLLAIELLRLDLLSTRKMFPTYSGEPLRGTAEDKRNSLLVSRVACLMQMKHQPIGYTGPLSRHLLAYQCIATKVRQNSRNVMEMCALTLMLNGDADREGKPPVYMDLELPLLSHADCALGTAVKSYFDECIMCGAPTSEESKKAVKAKHAEDYFPYSKHLEKDMARAFALWEAVYAGVKVSGNLVKEKAVWDECHEWLALRK